MIKFIKSRFSMFYRYRFLLQNLIQRDIKVKYRRSTLGILWSVLNPLMMMCVLTLVFSYFFRFDIANYPVYVLSGQLLFTYFTESTSMAMESVIGYAPLIKKVHVPKYIFPLEKSCFGFINMCFSLVALVLVMLITRAPFHPTFILVLYPMVTLFVFSLGVGMFLASSAIFFRDIIHLWSVFTTALMYASAVFYPVTLLDGTVMQYIIRLNPLFWYIDAFRCCVMDGRVFGLAHVVVCAVCAVIAMIVGCITFKKGQDKFILYI
ncbi:MAG: ABC transporter permease [Oscillospiraceae bacterium]|nr:ABC transporter permease [Oscillospiraceae bacterium]